MLDAEEAERISRLVRSISPLPSIHDLAPAKILELLSRDKKTVGGHIHWVVPERIGSVRIVPDVPLDVVAAALHSAQREGGK